MNFRTTIFILGISFILVSCVKQDTTNPIPVISFASFSAQDENIAYLTINYEDGDGDIFAESGTTTYNYFAFFFYKDANGNFIDASYVLPYVIIRPSALSVNQSIKGQIMVTMTGWRSSSVYKNFKYKIYMIDQKGHKSNELMTPEIVAPF